MLNDALTNFEGEVEPAESGVAHLEIFHDAQRVQVVVKEKAVFLHGNVESLFSGMTERRMADVVYQGEGLDEINVQAELRRDGSRDLRDLNGMGQAIAKVVGVPASEDLGLGFEAAKGPGVDDAIAVTLKVVAVRMRRLGETASAGLLHPHGVVGEHEESLAEAAISNWHLALADRDQADDANQPRD